MADYVKKRTHIINHVRFLDAGPVARDLYDWGMLWSGQQETDGQIPMSALLVSPWGAGGKRNVVVAAKLVLVGLWERTDTGFAICKWAEQGNVTKSELVEKRQVDRDRKAAYRKRQSEPCPSGTPLGTIDGTPGGVRTDSLPLPLPLPLSESGSREGMQGETEPPEWFIGAIATVEMATGATIEPGAAWLRYQGHRSSNGKPMSAPDARYWLTTVDVREAQKDRLEAARVKERDAKFDRARAGGSAPGDPPPKQTAAQSKAFNDELARRMAERRAREKGAA